MKEWIYSPRFDGFFILGPAFFITLLVFLIPGFSKVGSEVPLWAWVLFVMLIDVSHVYSTLYRTYFDKDEFDERKMLYTLAPLICFISGVFIYSISSLLFWSILAYVAVYHFVRQQYGFMMIYLRKGKNKSTFSAYVDKLLIYWATIYPLVYWHTHPRKFSWFMEGDFLYFDAPLVSKLCGLFYLALIIIYLCKESCFSFKLRNVNYPKNLLLLGTMLSWYTGIVLYNGDMSFTLINVVSHGIPYMALIWVYGNLKWKKKNLEDPPWISKIFTPSYALIFIALLCGFAFIEEAFWDILVWRERPQLFFSWFNMSAVKDSQLLNILVPLLALPQATHYVVDGFIWRLAKPAGAMKKVMDGQ